VPAPGREVAPLARQHAGGGEHAHPDVRRSAAEDERGGGERVALREVAARDPVTPHGAAQPHRGLAVAGGEREGDRGAQVLAVGGGSSPHSTSISRSAETPSSR
jgi:hypothetical protein